ncbi:AAA family ATPase [Flavobacterium alkalisoli]|uniref:AAA family ATPase n=1 Tax=Flavobacterium alkalisoli TaxID=2602769 RepID=A0A5B9G1H0_9FLAO|nr:AAA family ATPase [Flavobacterium alkalisoli]QEE51302.1 AAA family ATPase [Flavobacterium alkalisoli]
MEIKDLSINEDILNLFNYTLNDDAKATVKNLLLKPLETKEQILYRQHVLKGFLENISLFETYSYSRIDFRQVYIFLQSFDDEEFLEKGLKLKLHFSKQKHYDYRSRCVQLIMLFHRLHNHYIKNIVTVPFPEEYKNDIRLIDDFLSSFKLDYYENLIRAHKFGVKHIVQILKLISIKKRKKEIVAFQDAYTLFEAYISIAKGIIRHKLAFPEISEKQVALTQFYHPLLANPVKNSFEANSNVVLITGPNMSGKSTLLKAISICIYLGNIGFAVPAQAAKIPKYDNISVFINLNDDLQSGYSHFMTEIINLKKVVEQSGTDKPHYAVFDELFRGTNIDDALEISKATLKGLLNFKNSLFFVSSHLHQLTEMEEIQNGSIATYYLDCNLKESTPAFTYELKPGWSDIKIGRILFEKEGLNELLQHKHTLS